MGAKRSFLVFVVLLALTHPGHCDDAPIIEDFRKVYERTLALPEAAGKYSQIVKDFLRARVLNNEWEMEAIIERNKTFIPAEIRKLLDMATAPGAAEDLKRLNFHTAELMATIYKDKYADMEPLKEFKKRYFDTLLTPPQYSTVTGGVHIVEIPPSTGTANNVFSPDNIIIKKGDVVRWVNNDSYAHVLASMPLIGAGEIAPTRIEPKEELEFTFKEAGEYYYMCYIHRAMVGKIAVEEQPESR